VKGKNVEIAQSIWGTLPQYAIEALDLLTRQYSVRIALGELLYLEGKWYVTHAGLLAIANRKQCFGIRVQPVPALCEPKAARWTFKATVYKSHMCKGFAGYGDADPTNVSSQVRGAEMRVAETRAVNRALRKAYGIGICSVEEIGASPKSSDAVSVSVKLPPASANGHSGNGSPRVRDRLCQLIRQHQLDANLVKAYAVDFCGTKTLREATRDQVENFVVHLAEWAENDRNALLCQLNSYPSSKDGAA